MANHADGAILGLSTLTNAQNVKPSLTSDQMVEIEHKITPSAQPPPATDKELDDLTNKILKDIARQVGSASILGDNPADESGDDYSSDEEYSDTASRVSSRSGVSAASSASAVSRSSRRSHRSNRSNRGFSGFASGPPIEMNTYSAPLREERSLTDRLRERNRQANLDRALGRLQYHEEGLLDDALAEDQKMNLLIEIDQDWDELKSCRVDLSTIEKPKATNSLDEIALVHRRLREKIRYIQNADIGEHGMMYLVNTMCKFCDGTRPYLPDLDGWGPQAKILLHRNRSLLSRGVSKTASEMGMGDLGLAFTQLAVSAAAYSALRTAQSNAVSSAERNQIESRGLASELRDMESAADVAKHI